LRATAQNSGHYARHYPDQHHDGCVAPGCPHRFLESEGAERRTDLGCEQAGQEQAGDQSDQHAKLADEAARQATPAGVHNNAQKDQVEDGDRTERQVLGTKHVVYCLSRMALMMPGIWSGRSPASVPRSPWRLARRSPAQPWM